MLIHGFLSSCLLEQCCFFERTLNHLFSLGDSELTHAYIQDETDSCLSDSGSDFGEMCHQQDVHDVLMDPPLQTCDGREHNPEVSLPQTSQRMNEEPEQREDTLCPCRAVHSRWSNNQWPTLPPPCCNGVNQSS